MSIGVILKWKYPFSNTTTQTYR